MNFINKKNVFYLKSFKSKIKFFFVVVYRLDGESLKKIALKM